MNNTNDNENIIFLLEEKNVPNGNEVDIQKMMEEFNEELNNSDYDSLLNNDILNQEDLETLFYQEYTVKDLLKICNYYNIDKDIRSSKCKKQDIISTIIYFESLPENFDIVQKRTKMWAYITELLNDSKMKKFIIWN